MHRCFSVFIVIIGLICLTDFGPLSEASVCHADDVTCKVLRISGNAWVSPAGKSVKKTIAPGDSLKEGDMLEVGRNHSVLIAFGQSNDNIVQVQGSAVVGISMKKGVRLEVKEGEVYALLDRWQGKGPFEVGSPTALTVVNGTYFHVGVMGARTKVVLYRGRVAVHRRADDGRLTLPLQILTPGQFTMVSRNQFLFSRPRTVGRSEFDRLNAMIDSLGVPGKEQVDYDQAAGQHYNPMEPQGRSRLREDIKKASEGFIIF